NAAGQTITTQSLAGDGIGTLSATTWGKGVYLLQFIGKGTSQTIKIVR
ncbi:MAG: T9SS type A sorting domain-containing protein, partial [Paraprevotella sp.]|nr:T9SS type A sorting domain-containing protein [Paraprevotella sp.]